ncbi:hypothetical protein Btru_069547 [Bulinus truncatus]|nr:hypothetical protein Btru_069547 [Bulinus truncatus]
MVTVSYFQKCFHNVINSLVTAPPANRSFYTTDIVRVTPRTFTGDTCENVRTPDGGVHGSCVDFIGSSNLEIKLFGTMPAKVLRTGNLVPLVDWAVSEPALDRITRCERLEREKGHQAEREGPKILAGLSESPLPY